MKKWKIGLWSFQVVAVAARSGGVMLFRGEEHTLEEFPNFAIEQDRTPRSRYGDNKFVVDDRVNINYKADDNFFEDGQLIRFEGTDVDVLKFGGSKELSGNTFNGGQTVLVKDTIADVLLFGGHGDRYNGGMDVAVEDATVGTIQIGNSKDIFDGVLAVAVEKSQFGALRVGMDDCTFSRGLFIGVATRTFRDLHVVGKFGGDQDVVVETSTAGKVVFGDDNSEFGEGKLSVDIKSKTLGSLCLRGKFYRKPKVVVETVTLGDIAVGSASSSFEKGLTLVVKSRAFGSIVVEGEVRRNLRIVLSAGSQLGPVIFGESFVLINGQLTLVLSQPNFHFDDTMRDNVDHLFEEYFDNNVMFHCNSVQGRQVLVLNGYMFARTDTLSQYLGYSSPKTFLTMSGLPMLKTAQPVFVKVAKQVDAVVKDRDESGWGLVVNGKKSKSFVLQGRRNMYEGHQTFIVQNQFLVERGDRLMDLYLGSRVHYTLFQDTPVKQQSKNQWTWLVVTVVAFLLFLGLSLCCMAYANSRHRPVRRGRW